ncbi:hypothetical protein FHL15_002681 [Xylaria flabelliformis]|uniref:F-box domain-containing protein n=1 Tax=Xylaria flabelliformis TaxID=2512241 RepID=A0A553I879_9PEZI|nr:hypothetical protein FHL15_002681 [Xylaria flabelliformis]
MPADNNDSEVSLPYLDTNTSINTIYSIKTITNIITDINKMLSLSALPNEVLEMIVDLLLDSGSPYTIRSVSSVNRTLRTMVHYCHHKLLRIPPSYNPEGFNINQSSFLSAYLHSPAVRSIELVFCSHDRHAQFLWNAVYRLVPTLKGLRDIHVPIPVEQPPASESFSSPLRKLLDTLRHHSPLVRVHARLRDLRYGFAPLRVFRHFSNLRALEFTVYKSPDFRRNTPEILLILRTILITCPNLRILKLYTRTVEDQTRMTFVSYQPTYINEERPRCLESLELQNSSNWEVWRIPSDLLSQGSNESSGNCDNSWAEEFFDWSQLTHLRIKEVKLLPYLAYELTALKSFEAPNVSGYHRHILIRSLCPCLEEFELSVRRRTKWPEDKLEALARFPKLRSLTIITRFVEDGIPFISPTLADLSRPFITFREVKKLYKRLAGVGYRNRIRRLCYRYLEFNAEPAERDDEAARGLVDVTCPQDSGIDAEEGVYKYEGVIAMGRTPVDSVDEWGDDRANAGDEE